MIFFSLIKPDITQDELNLLDSAVIRTYAEFGIAFDNESLYDKSGNFKPMPTLKDLYAELCAHEETKRLSLMIEKFATGSLASFGRETNVDLTNKYIVLDMTEMTDALKPIGMFMALEFVWDKAKESRIQKKVIFLDELWTLIGSGRESACGELCAGDLSPHPRLRRRGNSGDAGYLRAALPPTAGMGGRS